MFGQSILSNLKHLRLYDPGLNHKNVPALVRKRESFGELRVLSKSVFMPENDEGWEANIECAGITECETFRMWIIFTEYSLRLDLAHSESFEKLITSIIKWVEVKKLKNLKYLYLEIDSPPLSDLIWSSWRKSIWKFLTPYRCSSNKSNDMAVLTWRSVVVAAFWRVQIIQQSNFLFIWQ